MKDSKKNLKRSPKNNNSEKQREKIFGKKIQQMCTVEGVAQFRFSEPGYGFGGFSFYIENGKLKCENECMNRARIIRYLIDLVMHCEMNDK